MELEMQLLVDNKTWNLVEVLKNQALIDCKWVYKLKYNLKDDESKFFKSTLMVWSFTKEKSVDYNTIFPPLVKYATFWLVYALVTIFIPVMDKIDVIIAFLYNNIYIDVI